MMADECFDGISDLPHDPMTTLISDIKDIARIHIYCKHEGCPATEIQNKGESL